MSRPLRELTTYLVIAFSLAIGLAVALPHAQIGVLLSALAPVTAVLIITAFATPRGSRRRLWGEFGLRRSGKSTWLFALVVPMLLAGMAYGAALVLNVADLRHVDLTSLRRRRLDPEPRRRDRVHDRFSSWVRRSAGAATSCRGSSSSRAAAAPPSSPGSPTGASTFR